MQILMFTEFIGMNLTSNSLIFLLLYEIRQVSIQVEWQWVRGRACERLLVSDWLLGYMKEVKHFDISGLLLTISMTLNTQTRTFNS